LEDVVYQMMTRAATDTDEDQSFTSVRTNGGQSYTTISEYNPRVVRGTTGATLFQGVKK
jgi:hypothetical protein